MTEAPPLRLRELLATLRKYYLLVLVPTIGFAVLAGVYATRRAKSWQATQTLTVRDEAGGSSKGRFLDSESMQTAQETVLEIARSYEVVEGALRQVGVRGAQTLPNWPPRNIVEDLQSRIALTAPKGKEFGKTEIIYLSVKAPSTTEAVELTQAVSDQLIERLKQVRTTRTQSVIDELLRARELANKDLTAANQQLGDIERTLGPDLSELRTLNQSSSTSGHLTTVQIQIHSDLRGSKNRHLQALEDRQHLQTALDDPTHLRIGAPRSLLTAYPQLERLTEGLADAQLNKSQLRGQMTDLHPKVRAAALAETKVRNELRQELTVVLAGLENEIKTHGKLVDTYKLELAQINGRLKKISSLRLTYQNHEHQVKQRAQIVEQIDSDLAAARSSLVAAKTTSLVQRMSAPVPGERPLGPGTMMIIAVGLAGGMLTGVALVFLIAPFDARRGRRSSDQVGGRRNSDQAVGRRGEDAGEQRGSRSNQFAAFSTGRRLDEKVPTPAAEPLAPAATETVAAPSEPSQPAIAAVQNTEGDTSQQEVAAFDAQSDEDLILTSSTELQATANAAATTESPSDHRQPRKPLTLVESLSRIAAKR